jgi:DNA-binding CsgD family transcriptional regulator
MNEVDARDVRLASAALLLVVTAGTVVDLMLDQPPSLLSGHVLFELALATVSLSGAAYLGWGWYRTEARLAAAERAWHAREDERSLWLKRSQSVLDALARELGAQFDAWSLTPAERRTALGLLKGLSHKRIGRLTGTSERTVRQHAVAVYRKSGLAGRAELAGFFLEGLTLPEGDGSLALAHPSDPRHNEPDRRSQQ